MKASLNGAVLPEGLTPALERTLTVSANGLPVESVTKSAEQTVQTARNQQLMVTSGLVVAGVVFLASFMPVVDPHDRWLIYPLTAVMMSLLLVFMIVMVVRRTSEAKRRVARRLDGMPEPGATIIASDSGLAIGARAYAWADLTLTAADLMRGEISPTTGSTITYVKAIEIQSPSGPVLLIDDQITNARAMIDTLWRKLRR